MFKIDMKHNFDQFSKELSRELTNTINKSKKEILQAGANVIKEDIKENYDDEFQKALDPNSAWQKLKKKLGMEGEPGHFTGATVESIIAKATEQIGEVMLEGNWPDKATSKNVSDRLRIAADGVRIENQKGTKEMFIPSEPFKGKRYGKWAGEDIVFMKLRPDATKQAVREMQRILDREIEKLNIRLSKK